MDQDKNYIENTEEETRELEELEELDSEDSKLAALDEDLGTETSTDLAILQEGIQVPALMQTAGAAVADVTVNETALPGNAAASGTLETAHPTMTGNGEEAATTTAATQMAGVVASGMAVAEIPAPGMASAMAAAEIPAPGMASGMAETEIPTPAATAGTDTEETDEGAAAAQTASAGQTAQTASVGQTAQGRKEAAAAQSQSPRMVSVVGVRFRTAGRVYYFSSGQMDIHRGTHVIVDTTRGMEYGTAVSVPFLLDQNKFKAPLRNVMRIATTADTDQHEEHVEREMEARRICQQRIRAHHLEMKLIDAEYTFDGNKILFYFTADGRVDFRDLVRDLAGIFHTRIELRQVGVRDETRILGGYGVCGRPLCCHTYLTDFVPVSIRMAKEQNLSLNPAKISGVCGRLMCCLKNEEETYEELNKTLPHVGDEVESADGLQGEVENVNVLRQRVRIIVEKDDEKELHEYDAKDLTVLRRRRRGQAKPHFRREDVSGGVTSHVKDDAGTQQKSAGDILEGTDAQMDPGNAPEGQRTNARADESTGGRIDAGVGGRMNGSDNANAGRRADTRAGGGARTEARNRGSAGAKSEARTNDANSRRFGQRSDSSPQRERMDTTADRQRAKTSAATEQPSAEEAEHPTDNAGSRRSGRRNLRRDRQPGRTMARVTQAQDAGGIDQKEGGSQKGTQSPPRNQHRMEGPRPNAAAGRKGNQRGNQPADAPVEKGNRPADKRGNFRGQPGGRKRQDRTGRYSGDSNNLARQSDAKDARNPGNGQE